MADEEPLDEGEKEHEKAGLKLDIQKTKIMASSPFTSWQIDGENNGNSSRSYFLGFQNPFGWWLQLWNLKMLASWKRSYDKSRQDIKKQLNHFANKGPFSQSDGFSSSHVQMWELNHGRLSAEELMLSNCSMWEDSRESLGQQGTQISQS